MFNKTTKVTEFLSTSFFFSIRRLGILTSFIEKERGIIISIELKRSIRKDPTKSVRCLAHAKQVSAMTVQIEVKKDLKMKYV